MGNECVARTCLTRTYLTKTNVSSQSIERPTGSGTSGLIVQIVPLCHGGTRGRGGGRPVRRSLSLCVVMCRRSWPFDGNPCELLRKLLCNY